MRRREFLLGLVFVTGCKRDVAACAAPRPHEVTDASTAQFCGMALTEHGGPKGQIFIRGLAEPYWFASVRDTFAFAILPEMPKAISAIYVSDMARAKNWEQPEPGLWVEARNAVYVIRSKRRSGMGTDEAVPFSISASARDFAAANGGQVVSFAEMPSDYILAAPSGEK